MIKTEWRADRDATPAREYCKSCNTELTALPNWCSPSCTSECCPDPAERCHYCGALFHADERAKKPPLVVFIAARQWHNKTYGNVYYSARVYVDGELVILLPFQYGYGNQYEYEAMRELAANGYIPEEYATRPIWHLRDFGTITHTATEWRTRTDTKKWGTL